MSIPEQYTLDCGFFVRVFVGFLKDFYTEAAQVAD